MPVSLLSPRCGPSWRKTDFTSGVHQTTKPRAVLRSIEAVVLSSALALGIVALFPTEASAGFCSPYGPRTVNAWGDGATCTAARNDCSANAWAAAETYCNTRYVCNAQPVVFHQADCYWQNNKWNIDCHMDFYCTLPG